MFALGCSTDGGDTGDGIGSFEGSWTGDGDGDTSDSGDGDSGDGDGDGDSGDGDGDSGDGDGDSGDGDGDSGDGDGDGGLDGTPGEFVLDHDSRTYRLYVPQCYSPQTASPLVIGFHGAGDSGSNFYAVAKATGWSSVAESACFILMIPDTKSPYDDFAVWSGNPNNDIPQMIAEMDGILEIVGVTGEHYNLDPNDLHGFGFSDGGLFVAVTELEHSTTFASATIIGYGWGAGYIVQPARQIPMQFVVGANDNFYSYAQQSESFLSGQGHVTVLRVGNGLGHDFIGLMGQHPPDQLYGWMSSNPLP